jgi:hypothetical protein
LCLHVAQVGTRYGWVLDLWCAVLRAVWI